MGNWKLEAFKIGIYLMFPVGIFVLFNTPSFYQEAIYQHRKTLLEMVDPQKMKEIEELKVQFRKKKFERLNEKSDE